MGSGMAQRGGGGAGGGAGGGVVGDFVGVLEDALNDGTGNARVIFLNKFRRRGFKVGQSSHSEGSTDTQLELAGHFSDISRNNKQWAIGKR